MQLFRLFITLLITFYCYGQDKKALQGIVLVNKLPFENVNVKNKNTTQLITTNTEGAFIISANSGDTLVFSSVALDSLTIVLTAIDILSDGLQVVMNKKSIQLNEIVIKNYSAINAYALGITDKIKTLSRAERKLKTAGDFKPIDLLSILGGTLSVDPILNAINGRTQKIKKEIIVEKKRS